MSNIELTNPMTNFKPDMEVVRKALLDAIEAAATLGDASETDRLLVLLAAVNAEIRTHLNP